MKLMQIKNNAWAKITVCLYRERIGKKAGTVAQAYSYIISKVKWSDGNIPASYKYEKKSLPIYNTFHFMFSSEKPHFITNSYIY